MMEMLKFQFPPYTSTPKSIPVSPVESPILPDFTSTSTSFADDDVHNSISHLIAQLDDQVNSLSSFYEQQFSSQFAALDAQLQHSTTQLAGSNELLLQYSTELVRLREDNSKLAADFSCLRTAPVDPASPTVFSSQSQADKAMVFPTSTPCKWDSQISPEWNRHRITLC